MIAARAAVASVVTILFALFGSLPATAQSQAPDELVVEISPVTVDVDLGEKVEIEVSVTNRGSSPTDELAVHIDITDPSAPGSVDPEDWTATLTRPAGVIEPGATTTLSWVLQPISGGDFSVYAVALSPDNSDVHATAEALDFTVIHQRTLNPEGVLPIALAMPLAVGALLLIQWRRPLMRRRTAAPAPA
ncbi:MAG: hypothetical protein OER95_00460 [Acidimicrobiia bacterium]|nr:hypothetical protein [Acidimicrobiia bacterium]